MATLVIRKRVHTRLPLCRLQSIQPLGRPVAGAKPHKSGGQAGQHFIDTKHGNHGHDHDGAHHALLGQCQTPQPEHTDDQQPRYRHQ